MTMASQSTCEFLTYLNELGSGDTQKPYKKLSELQIFKTYSILKKEVVTTKYGTSIVVELEDCMVHLPRRFATAFAFNEDKFKKFQDGASFLKIIGFKMGKFGKYPLIEFPRKKLSNDCTCCIDCEECQCKMFKKTEPCICIPFKLSEMYNY